MTELSTRWAMQQQPAASSSGAYSTNVAPSPHSRRPSRGGHAAHVVDDIMVAGTAVPVRHRRQRPQPAPRRIFGRHQHARLHRTPLHRARLHTSKSRTAPAATR